MAEAGDYGVKTLVFMDLETTGLKQHGVDPEITELFMLAVGREEFKSKSKDKVLNSMRLAFKTKRPISAEASEITGLNASNLSDQEIFDEKTITLLDLFLSRLQKPVCMLAHNGKRFDFKLLQAELEEFKRKLMPDLLCADTIEGFKQMDKKKLDTPSIGMAKLSVGDPPPDSSPKSPKISYSLVEVFKRKFPRADDDAHRAERDVQMMYKIALTGVKDFLNWVDGQATKFTDIKPM